MVTIVIPFFNRSKLVCGTISNIIGQTYSDWELIILDDGSEESEFNSVKSVCETDVRIRIEKRPDTKIKGAQSCRNIGLELAQGEFIIFFDSDDYIPEYCIEQRVTYMKQHPDLDFSVFPYAEFKSTPDVPETIGGLRFYSDDLKAFVARRLPFMVWSNIYKTESLRKHHINWDSNLKSLQDAYFNITVLCAGLKYDYAKDCLIDYYNRIGNKGDSISRSIYSPNQFDSHIYYLDNVRKAVSGKQGMKHPLRDGCLYIYSLMMYNYSEEHSMRLLTCLANDKWFCTYIKWKDAIYKTVLRKFHMSVKFSRWFLFPFSCISRKRILKRQREYCAANAHIYKK